MATYRDAFPSKYLKADDLGTSRPIGTIDTVIFETVGVGANAERKLVVQFREPTLKKFVLNLVNCDSIAEVAGTDDYERWAGTRIRLFSTKTEFQGKRVPCVRVSPPPAPALASASDRLDEVVGF